MGVGAVKFGEGQRAPISGDPAGLNFWEASLQIRHTRLLQLSSLRPVLFAEIITLIIGIYYARDLALGLVLGGASLFLIIVMSYIFWYGRFINCNKQHKTICPSCASRMWQLCCARCREPVPAIALFLWGAFLSHCPHCGLSLSCRRGTLLAWCPTCSISTPRPDYLYRKPTHIVVWIVTQLPSIIKDEWRRISPVGQDCMILYNNSAKHPSCILVITTNYESNEPPIKDQFINQVRLLLISSDVPPEHAVIIKGHFGSNTITETVVPFYLVE